MKSIELKIKIKSLLAEQQIIRKEESKIIRTVDYLLSRGDEGVEYDVIGRVDSLRQTLQSIQGHRRIKIRQVLRYAGLCRAYMRNQPYRAVESKNKPGNEVSPGLLTAELGRFFGKHIKAEDVDRWLKEECRQSETQAAA
jgi:hypothetical protein